MKKQQKTTRLQRLNCSQIPLQSLSLEQLETLAGGPIAIIRKEG